MNRFNLMHPAVLTLLAVIIASPVQAAVEAGKILYARGIVSIVDPQDSARGGESGSVLYEGERVITGRNALAQLRLSDGALIALRGSSDYQIEKQAFGEDESLYEQAGKLFTGWMRSITGTIGSKYPARVSQSTQVATIGIRGTVYQLIHIPEGGLPGYPGQEPGTYVYLESGSVEINGSDGTRLLQPGDVVFVPAAGGAPRLAPEKKQIFELVEGENVEVVETEDNLLSDLLNETVTEEFHAGHVTAIGSYDRYVNGSPVRYSSQDVEVVISGSGSTRAPTYIAYYEPDAGTFYYAKVLSGQTPGSTGNHTLAGGSLVNWGIWSPSQYAVSDSLGSSYGTPITDWHFMVADNVLADPMAVAAAGLTGTATYNYIGGTPLTGSAGTFTLNSGSFIEVDFATAVMNVDLQFTNGTFLVDDNLGNTIQDFYGAGISLSDDPSGVNPTFFGKVSGAFLDGGNGIISTVEAGSTGTSYGTALFEKSAAAQPAP